MIKLFYSYSHKDEEHLIELNKRLTLLKNEGVIDEWCDRQLIAGDSWEKEIEKKLKESHVILLLFSSDFIASPSCQKEMKMAIKLNKEKNIRIIPIILRICSWSDIPEIKELLALPKDGKALKEWSSKDSAWQHVYNGIKDAVREINISMKQKMKKEYRDNLLKSPVNNISLDKLFIYPDIRGNDSQLSEQLDDNEIDSQKLKKINGFKHKYVLIEGIEQIGKTSLCNMLFVHYLDSGYCPILINGKDICGKADIQRTVDEKYKNQYENKIDYWAINKEKRILLIDDIDEKMMSLENFSKFVLSIKEHFEYAIIFIDGLSNLSNRSTEQNYFSYFSNFSIVPSGHKKRNEIIKKCIAYDEGHVVFDSGDNRQLAKLDKSIKHIDVIIGTNIVPSYPVFIVTIFHAVEAIGQQDFSQTSYGHCYHAMLTLNLGKSNIQGTDIDAYFNFLAALAYFMFKNNLKSISKIEIDDFYKGYSEMHITPPNIIKNLIKANIVKEKNNMYKFQYVYIYYYFVAKYIADNINDKDVENQIQILISNIHMTDNANIIIFVTHHTKNQNLLDEILLVAMSAFEKFDEVTLSNKEKYFISKFPLEKIKLSPQNHSVEEEREKRLIARDKEEREEREKRLSARSESSERMAINDDEIDDPLFIEIKKSARSMEIIGQILKNQYGSLEKTTLKQLFKGGQSIGLRLIKSFIVLMEDFIVNNKEEFDVFIQSQLEEKTKGKDLSESELKKEKQKIIAQNSYGVLFSWLHRIVDAIGYDKLIEIADDVNNETNTVASKLINLFIHTWYTKQMDFEKIKSLHKEFKEDGNEQAIYILKDIVSRHIYMHHIDYKVKQKINSLLNFSLEGQQIAQAKIKHK